MAKGTGFRKFNSDDREITLLQDNVDSAFSQLQLSGISNGVLQVAVALVSGANTIVHKLGRRPRGYLAVSNSGGVLTDNIAAEGNDQNFTLTSSANCTVSLWIF